MKALQTRQIEVDVRYQLQHAFLSIQDIFDAVVELVTNADDRYQHLSKPDRRDDSLESMTMAASERFLVGRAKTPAPSELT